MNVYLLIHRHPDDYVGTPGTKAKWVAWFKELGDALVDMGNPVLDDRASVGKTGAALPLGGYTLVQAGNLEEASKLARRCPIVEDGGGVEVGRLTPRAGRKHPARTF